MMVSGLVLVLWSVWATRPYFDFDSSPVATNVVPLSPSQRALEFAKLFHAESVAQSIDLIN